MYIRIYVKYICSLTGTILYCLILYLWIHWYTYCVHVLYTRSTLVGGVGGCTFAANAAVSLHCTAVLVYRDLKKTNSHLRESPML